MNTRPLIIVFALCIGALIGWLVLDDATRLADTPEEKTEQKPTYVTHAPNKSKGNRKRNLNGKRVTLEDIIAIPNQRLIKFQDEESYRAFLNSLGDGNLKLLDKIDRLLVVGVSFSNLSDLDDLDEDALQYNFPVNIPQPGQVEDQPDAVGFGRNALAFLGIDNDNSAYGEGVKIAVLDTGVEPHLALSKGVQTINLTELSEGTDPHGHGTAVASLIAGDHANMKGVSPSASILSIRVTDDSGTSDSLTLAQGIITAVENGAQIINISMGSYGNSSTVREAINFATSNGAIIFASSGNDGYGQAAYPAANEGVISVGAVDANGTHLNFSNTSEDLGLTAPGLEVQAAWPGDQVIAFTGTSASTPFLAGATAALMSEGDMSAQQAVDHLFEYSNEGGVIGSDPFYGEGILHVGRALQSETAGIEDLAIASQYFPEENNENPYFQVVIENRGTETIWHSAVEVDVEGSIYEIPINSIASNDVKSVTIPITDVRIDRAGSLNIDSRLNLSPNTNDSQSSNNTRTDTFTHPDAINQPDTSNEGN